MTTESTAAPATVEMTSTAAPTEGATTTTSAPAIPGLAEAVADYQGHRARVMGKPEPVAAKPVPAEGTAKPEDGLAKTAGVADKPADAAATTEPEKPAEAAKEPAKEAPNPDEVSEGMVRILRQSRALERQKREIEAEKASAAAAKAAAEAERAENAKAIEAARKFEEMRKKDPVAATMELLGKETLGGTFPLDLINRLAEQDGPPTPEQIAEIATAKAEANIRAKLAEEVKAKEAADAEAKKKAEAERTVDVEQKKTAFFSGLHAQLMADPDKYSYLLADPVDWGIKPGPDGKPVQGSVDEYITDTFVKTGRPPTPNEILEHFNSKAERKAERLAAIYNKRNAKTTPAAPAPKTTTARASTDAPRDTRGRVETPPAGETQRERLERVARELNQSFGH